MKTVKSYPFNLYTVEIDNASQLNELEGHGIFTVTSKVAINGSTKFTLESYSSGVDRSATYQCQIFVSNGVVYRYERTITGSTVGTWKLVANLNNQLSIENEKVISEALIAIYSKVLALEEFIKNSTFEGAQIDALTIVKSILFQGAKIFNSGASAPTSTPDFIGQEYTNTTTKVTYKAAGVDSAADWKQITN